MAGILTPYNIRCDTYWYLQMCNNKNAPCLYLFHKWNRFNMWYISCTKGPTKIFFSKKMQISYNKALLYYNICCSLWSHDLCPIFVRSLIFSINLWFLQQIYACYSQIPSLYVNSYIFGFQCYNNIHGWVPVGWLRSVANDGACTIIQYLGNTMIG